MLGTDLKSIRNKRGLTQQSLAELSNISIPTVALLEQKGGLLSTLEQVLDTLEAEIYGVGLEKVGAIGIRIKTLRKKKKISQRKVASIIGATQATISKIENTSKGRLSIVIALAKICGCQLRVKAKEDNQSFFSETALSSVNEVWLTPPSTISTLRNIFGDFDLDPCAETGVLQNIRSKAHLCYTASDDGLTKPWFGTVFVNPPYSRDVGKWVKKCLDEVENNNAHTVIALLAARTDTKWWHEFIVGKASVFLIKGRLKFGDGKQSAPFPSAVVVWSNTDYDKEKLAQNLNAWLVNK